MWYYYRLAIHEQSSVRYTEVKKARIISAEENDVTFINPTTGMLKLVFRYPANSVNLKINIAANPGQIILQKNISSVNSEGILLNLSTQPAGVYWLTIEYEGRKIVKKIVKV